MPTETYTFQLYLFVFFIDKSSIFTDSLPCFSTVVFDGSSTSKSLFLLGLEPIPVLQAIRKINKIFDKINVFIFDTHCIFCKYIK